MIQNSTWCPIHKHKDRLDHDLNLNYFELHSCLPKYKYIKFLNRSWLCNLGINAIKWEYSQHDGWKAVQKLIQWEDVW